MSLHLVEFAQPIIRIVNTRFEDGGGAGNLESADHGGATFDSMGLFFDGGGVGGAHGEDARMGVAEEDGEDFFEAVGGDGAAEALEDVGVEDGVFFRGLWGGRGGGGAAGEGGAEAFRRKGLFEDGVVAVQLRRGRGAHGEEESAGRGFAQGAGEVGAVKTRHTEVGEDAVRGIGLGEIEGLGAAFGLENDTAFGLQQNCRNREAHRVVIDGEDEAGVGERPGMHVGDDFTHGLIQIHRAFAKYSPGVCDKTVVSSA